MNKIQYINFNGQFINKNDPFAKISNRAFLYGDGLFETIEVIQGQPVFLQQHLTRLKKGCMVLKIPFPAKALLLDEITQVSTAVKHGVVKVMLTRGSGGRGYRQPETIQVTRLVALHPFPDYPECSIVSPDV